ncbi:MAG TPA: glycosyltransferase [Gemmataceae bacterium]|jgi:hypothetical protein|nr:glycosyltransferase [Gemmataceae bacterium]
MMPHILFVTEKWCDGNPGCGKTNSEHNLFGSLHCSGLATHECFHFDEFFRAHGAKSDRALVRRLRDGWPRPDLVIATPLWGCELSPDLATYAQIFDSGIPIIFLWFDAAQPHIQSLAKELSRISAATIILDIASHEVFHDPKFIAMWTPQDPRIFHNTNQARNVDVSFVGGLKAFPDRQACLATVKEAGVGVLQSGGQRETNLSVTDYAAIHQSSKISLNFCRTPGGDLTQIKGRAFEVTRCGSMLLEDDNDHIKTWFQPGKDYVPFFSPDDLVDKIRYYLRHNDERETIAKNGHDKAMRLYNERMFWSRLLELGLRRPCGPLGGLLRRLRAQPLYRLPVRVWNKARRLVAAGAG